MRRHRITRGASLLSAAALACATLTVAAPLPAMADTWPALGADPSTELTDGQIIQVWGENWLGERPLQVTQCRLDMPLSHDSCDESTTTILTTANDGTVSGAFEVTQVLTTHDDEGGVFDCASSDGCGLVAIIWALDDPALGAPDQMVGPTDARLYFQGWGPNPHFTVSTGIMGSGVGGGDWPPHTEITITAGATTATTTGGDGRFFVGLDPYEFQIEPGDLVTVTAGTITKTHTITSLTIDAIDVDADTVSGTADSGTWVDVVVFSWLDQRSRYVVTDDDGVWVADFSVPSGPNPQDQPVSLVPGSSGWAIQHDEDGDGTERHWQVANPHFYVDPEWNGMWGHEWPADVGLDITVAGNPGYTGAAMTNEWGDFDHGIDPGEHQLDVGDVITVTDGNTVKTHVVTALTVTHVDTADDRVSGTAEAHSWVQVDAHGENWTRRTVQTDRDGSWVADFGVADGPEPWEQAFDLQPGSNGNALQVDEDGDATHKGWYVPNARFNVNRDGNSMWGHEWPADVGLDITVAGNPGYTGAAMTNEWGDFDHGIDPGEHQLDVGDVITVTDGNTVKTHVVTALTVTHVDTDNDRVSGTTNTPFAWVTVFANSGWDWSSRSVEADASGHWEVDFTTPQGWEQPFDIGPGVDISAYETDDDGDATAANVRMPNPRFNVHLEHNSMWGHEWPADVELDITVSGTPGYTGTAMTNEWGDFNHQFYSDEHQLDVGDVITVTDGNTVKAHVVTALTITHVDTDTDTVSGTTDTAYARVDVFVRMLGDEGMRSAYADELGNWMVDFSIADGRPPMDLVPGADISAYETDDDGDATHANWFVSRPHFNVHRDGNGMWGHEWPAEVQLDITVSGTPGYTGTAMTNEWGDFNHDIDPGEHQLAAGDSVTVAYGATSKTLLVSALDIGLVDIDDDRVSGTTDTPFAFIEVQANTMWSGSHRMTVADEFGNWGADFSEPFEDQPPYDLMAGVHVQAYERDDDGDATYAEAGTSNPHFNVHRDGNGMWGHQWPAEVELDITVTGTPGYSGTVMTNEWGDFHYGIDSGEHVLTAGDVVTVSDGVSTRTLLVTAITITVVDIDEDRVSGTTDTPYGHVEVQANTQWDGSHRMTFADEFGNWEADFSEPFYDQPPYDLVTGVAVQAYERDDHNNATVDFWWLSLAFFYVDPAGNGIWGHEWPAHVELDITVDGVPGYAGSTTTDEWGDFSHGIDPEEHQLIPGDVVTVTDGDTVKVHVVNAFAITHFDIDLDQITGTAEPLSEVRVQIFAGSGWLVRHVLANGDGVWMADFSAPVGPNPDDQAYDLVIGAEGAALQTDADGDATWRWWVALLTPSAPLDVTGVSGDGQIAVSWTAPESDGGAPIDSFTVTASPGGATCTTATLECTIDGLANGTPYSFTVVATNEVGDGPASDPSALVRPRGAVPAPSGFEDVPLGIWFTEAIDWVLENGITTGYGDVSVYRPELPVTRGQMVTFLHRMADSPTGYPSAGFPDVAEGAFYADAVDWAFATGITTGYGTTGLFVPDEPVTRAQMATFLHRLAGLQPGAPPAGFPDVPSGAFYSNAVDWIAGHEITTGLGTTGLYGPSDLVTRAQMATFLYRLARTPAAWDVDPLPSTVQTS